MDGAYCLLKHLVRHALPGTGIDSQLVLRVYGSEKNVTDPCHMLRLKLLFQPYVVVAGVFQIFRNNGSVQETFTQGRSGSGVIWRSSGVTGRWAASGKKLTWPLVSRIAVCRSARSK